MAEPCGRDALVSALDELAGAGRKVTLWLRDDDATTATPALARLLETTSSHAIVPVIAAIPETAAEDLIGALEGHAARIAVHGIGHHNHAGSGEKKCELAADRPAGAVIAALGAAHEKFARLAGRRLVPMLVPPWNRIAPELLPRIWEAGFTALSTFGRRTEMEPAPGVTRINTHLDLIDWAGARDTLPHDVLFERLGALVRPQPDPLADEPIGILTHHLVHDAAAWVFLDALFGLTASHPGVQWLAADRLPASSGSLPLRATLAGAG